MMEQLQSPARRRFLKASAIGTAFVIGCYLPFGRKLLAALPDVIPVPEPNLFLKIDSDNTVTLLSKYFEMGQGVTTGLATLVAEELDADWSDMRIEFAPNDASAYNNLMFGPVMATGGSTSMAGAWEQMRKLGAAVRQMLIRAAAQQWQLPVGELNAESGRVLHGNGQSATFGELAADAMQLPLPDQVNLKSPQDWKLIGKPLPRIDSPGKTDGSSTFALDIRRPGMLTAAVRRPPLFGAEVSGFNADAAREIPGVVDVVQIPGGVAVLAKDSWSAIRGRDALEVEWNTAKAETRSSEQMLADYRQQAQGEGLTALARGDAADKLAQSTRKLQLEFTFPYLAHAPMEPLNCVLEYDGQEAELWSGCQLQSVDDYAIAHTLGLKPEQVKIHTLYGGGSFGRRGDPLGRWVAELASISKALFAEGRGRRAPVHVIWTREDDIRGGLYRPMALHQVEAGLDEHGKLTGWQHKVVTQSIFTGTPFEAFMVKDGVDHASVEGIADTPYQIENLSVLSYNAQSPVPPLWWRSVGHSHTAHAMETTIDQLAQLAGQDPLEFRLKLLPDARDRAVLQLLGEKSNWDRKPGGKRGRGLAFHKSFGTRVAMVADVTLNETDFKVDKITAAVDCGVPINPDVIAAQIEGAVGFALSSLLRNRITLDAGRVQQSNFHDYEPTRMREMPRVEVHIMPSSEAPSGIGEPGVPPLAPAVGNAIAAASGKRMYAMPFAIPPSRAQS